jgi:hypothetical protein
MDIVTALDDPNLFLRWFLGASWNGWRAILKAAFALQMTDAERAFFTLVARREPPRQQVRELWIVAGRRSGFHFCQRHRSPRRRTVRWPARVAAR